MLTHCYLSGDVVHDRAVRAFFDGCPTEKNLRNVRFYEPSDVAVVFGVFKKAVGFSKHRGKVIEEQKHRGMHTVVLETGYINRGDGPEDHYAAGLDGLNNRADFRNRGMPDDRATLLRKAGLLRVLNWRADGRHIVLCGQVPWDASCDFVNMVEWLRYTSNQIKQRTSRPIVFRPHPLAKLPPIPGTEYSTRPIMRDLRDAWALVTFNSNSAVEAVIKGIPVFAFDEGAMTYDIAGHWLDEIEHPRMPDRTQWLNDLAYAQWTLPEMREGRAWAHLFR